MAKSTDATEGAQFVRYFGPLLDALRKLGGSGAPSEVVERIAEDLKIPEDVQNELLDSGAPHFPNQVAWHGTTSVERVSSTHQNVASGISLRKAWSRTLHSSRLPDATTEPRVSGRMLRMRIASGRVIDGRVELDGADLPEGAAVTVLLSEGDETFEADPETERMLLDSIAQCERGQTVPLEKVLENLRRRE
jgi:hypothetical protein